MNKKKDIERAILDRFLINLDTSLKLISITECETPDFILETTNKKISIELTNLMNPVIKEKEEFKNVIIKNAEKLFKDRNNIEMYVVINFKDIEIKGTQKDIKQYSQKIFEIVENVYLANLDFEFDVTVKNIESSKEFINRIYITNKVSSYKWQSIGAHRVEWVSIDWIFKKILYKQRNINRYKYPF